MNNAPDYDDNLAFAHKMTWEELCKYAESKGGFIDDNKDIIFSKLCFEKDGCIYIDFSELCEEQDNICFAVDRTYEQMKTIIEALWG